MSLRLKQFTKINDSFVCEICGTQNFPAPKTCRDHCTKCLCSKHVDKNPGDRAEECQGVLRPVDVETKGGVITKIVYECEKCKAIRKNKVAEDDDKTVLFDLMAKKAF